MLRYLLAVLLLVNYLLVVGAGLVAERAEAPTFSIEHPYVHSRHCQQQNYLRLDCFEQCNGRQQTAATKLPAGTGLHFLAQLKGLDVHCAAELAQTGARPPFRAVRPGRRAAATFVLTGGFGGRDYPPPRRG